MAGVCEQLSPDQLADPSGEDSGPQFTTFVRILASGRKEVRRAALPGDDARHHRAAAVRPPGPARRRHPPGALWVLLQWGPQGADQLQGPVVDNSELRARVMTFCRAHEGMQEAGFRLSSSRHTFSFLAASMVFTLVAAGESGETENHKFTSLTTEQLVAAERRQAAEAFSTGSTSEQKKYARFCGAGKSGGGLWKMIK